MNGYRVLCSFSVFLGVCVLGISGCQRANNSPVASGNLPANVGKDTTTIDQVCQLTATMMGVDRSKVNSQSSLGDFGADELDFVELIMELEETFDVRISDDEAERMLGSKDWKQGMNKVTMEKLAALVEKRKKLPPAQTEREKFALPKVIGPQSAKPIGSDQVPDAAQVKVFLNPLIMILAGAEKQKGKPLSREEVLAIRDQSPFVMMAPEQAQRFYAKLDSQVRVHRINPDRIWEEWQEIRAAGK